MDDDRQGNLENCQGMLCNYLSSLVWLVCTVAAVCCMVPNHVYALLRHLLACLVGKTTYLCNLSSSMHHHHPWLMFVHCTLLKGTHPHKVHTSTQGETAMHTCPDHTK